MELIKMARNLAAHHTIDTVAAFLEAVKMFDENLYEDVKYAIDWNMLGWDEITGYVAKRVGQERK